MGLCFNFFRSPRTVVSYFDSSGIYVIKYVLLTISTDLILCLTVVRSMVQYNLSPLQ